MFGHLLYGCAWQQATVLLLRKFEILGKRHKVATPEEEGQNHALRHIASIVIVRWRV